MVNHNYTCLTSLELSRSTGCCDLMKRMQFSLMSVYSTNCDLIQKTVVTTISREAIASNIMYYLTI